MQVATLVQADWLFLLTDVPALYTANPSTDPTARPIHEVHEVAELQVHC
jgi:glutamate 5-kinase